MHDIFHRFWRREREKDIERQRVKRRGCICNFESKCIHTVYVLCENVSNSREDQVCVQVENTSTCMILFVAYSLYAKEMLYYTILVFGKKRLFGDTE